MTLNYVTGNERKFSNAQSFFASYDIKVKQLKLDIDEIQSEDALKITTAKARAAYERVRCPLFVNDATWLVPALNGFPGPFMKYINHWFAPEDFIHLMHGKTDRRIILRDTIVYIDEAGDRVFTHDHEGVILEQADQLEYSNPTDVVVSLSKNGTSIAEAKAKGNFFIEDEDRIWREFAEWVKKGEK